MSIRQNLIFEILKQCLKIGIKKRIINYKIYNYVKRRNKNLRSLQNK